MTSPATTQVRAEQLAAAAAIRMFFGHQSVGANVLGGIPAVYAAQGLKCPTITTDPFSVTNGGFIAHAYIGENTKPRSKIEDFDSILRDGIAEIIDVALIKLCYVDVDNTTDVHALFEQYHQALATLERDYPDVTFLHATAPVTTESPALKRAIKRALGRPDTYSADNVARERYNSLVRQTYGQPGRLFDIAAIESTSPAGMRVFGRGNASFALAPAFAADAGHLNALGSKTAGAGLLRVVAKASQC